MSIPYYNISVAQNSATDIGTFTFPLTFIAASYGIAFSTSATRQFITTQYRNYGDVTLKLNATAAINNQTHSARGIIIGY